MIERDASTSFMPQFLVRDWYLVQYYSSGVAGPCSIVEAQHTTFTTWHNSLYLLLSGAGIYDGAAWCL